jgi:starch synthase (maltosyl-transferring)
MTGRLWIGEITPRPEGGAYPAKAVVGEWVPVGAVAFREGHDAMGCEVAWRGPDGADRPVARMVLSESGTDAWQATIRPDATGTWTFTIRAFHDPYLTWRNAVMKKMEAGQSARDLANDLAVGAALCDRARAQGPHRPGRRGTGGGDRRCAT